jgi:hypothetical protein
MTTYEDIRKANAAITPTNIKGKGYAEVNQRVTAFRMVYPTGCITTEIVSLQNGVCVMKSTCIDGEGNVLGVGHAYEKEDSSFINKTSYIENCETSAVGRALGMAGFGIDTSICSAEELQNAVLNQDNKGGSRAKNGKADAKISKNQASGLQSYANSLGISADELCRRAGVKSVEDMTMSVWQKATMWLNGIAEKKEATA